MLEVVEVDIEVTRETHQDTLRAVRNLRDVLRRSFGDEEHVDCLPTDELALYAHCVSYLSNWEV